MAHISGFYFLVLYEIINLITNCCFVGLFLPTVPINFVIIYLHLHVSFNKHKNNIILLF